MLTILYRSQYVNFVGMDSLIYVAIFVKDVLMVAFEHLILWPSEYCRRSNLFHTRHLILVSYRRLRDIIYYLSHGTSRKHILSAQRSHGFVVLFSCDQKNIGL